MTSPSESRMSDMITVSGPCDLPDTPENRARIERAFRAWVGAPNGEVWVGADDGVWRVSDEWEIDSYESDEHVYRVLFSDDGPDHLTFEEVR